MIGIKSQIENVVEYNDLTDEKLQAIIEEVFNSQESIDFHYHMDRWYRCLDPKLRKQFDELMREEVNKTKNNERTI